MAIYSQLSEDSIEYLRDKFRNDVTLVTTILGLSGTTAAINNIFAGRPRGERVNPDGNPYFELPRMVIDLVDDERGKVGNNQDGFNESVIQLQVSSWVSNTSWSTMFKVHDRIGKILEDDNMPVTGGSSRFEILAGNIIDDPDREDTKMGTLRVNLNIFGGNT